MDPSARLQQLAEAVIDMHRDTVAQLVRAALDEGLSPCDILSHGLSQGMRVVGHRFRDGDYFMPEVLVCCDTYYAGLEVVQPLIEASGVDRSKGTIVIGTIHGDIHTVGKDVAIPVFRAAGFKVVDLGIDVPDKAFVDAIREHEPDIVGLGTYMTSTFMHTGDTVKAIEQAGLRGRVKIICGGPAVDARTARKMGADDASNDAWEGVEKMEAWVA
ncbi:MAG: cobalamin B12-binding domain-containing protein [Planctomycetes bacterium]|nr:cobalamin B12-binding domain-containing protein [Planctomycetota bacterium]